MATTSSGVKALYTAQQANRSNTMKKYGKPKPKPMSKPKPKPRSKKY